MASSSFFTPLMVASVLGDGGQQGLQRSVNAVNNVIGFHVGHRRRGYRQRGCSRYASLAGAFIWDRIGFQFE